MRGAAVGYQGSLKVPWPCCGRRSAGPSRSRGRVGSCALQRTSQRRRPLVEVPLVGYLVRPEDTAERVVSVAIWLNANGLRVTGWLIGAVGIGLIVQGLAAATS